MRKAKALFVATVVAATISAPLGGMARAESSRVVVASRFRVAFVDSERLGHTMNECSVKVPRGASGIAVLKAAKRAGCIDSYVLSRSQYGVVDYKGNSTYVACINGVCRAGYTVWWLVYSPGGPGSSFGDHRLEGFRAGRSTTLEFRYTPTW